MISQLINSGGTTQFQCVEELHTFGVENWDVVCGELCLALHPNHEGAATSARQTCFFISSDLVCFLFHFVKTTLVNAFTFAQIKFKDFFFFVDKWY